MAECIENETKKRGRGLCKIEKSPPQFWANDRHYSHVSKISNLFYKYNKFHNTFHNY